MIWKEELVFLSSILLEDDTFKITTEENTDALARSINNSGLINPPILLIKNSGYCVISGFRRIKAIQSLEKSDLVARVLSKNNSDLEYVKIAISDNSFQRQLNLIEISKCYKMLSSYFDEKTLPEAALSLGLPDNPALIKKIIRLCDLPVLIQKYILEDTLSLAMALELTKPEYNQTGTDFAIIFDKLKLSLNKQREFLTLCYEIAANENITIADLLKEDDISNILDDKDIDRNQKTRLIRNYLKKRRFPNLVKFESEFEKNLKKLNLLEGVKLIPPPNFEGSSFHINMELKKTTDLNEKTKYLNKLIENPVLQKILSKEF